MAYQIVQLRGWRHSNAPSECNQCGSSLDSCVQRHDRRPTTVGARASGLQTGILKGESQRNELFDFMGGQAGHAPTFCRRRLTHVAASIGAASIG